MNWRDTTHLTPTMTTAQVVETLVTVNNNSPVQDYVYPYDHTQPTYVFCIVPKDEGQGINLVLAGYSCSQRLFHVFPQKL